MCRHLAYVGPPVALGALAGVPADTLSLVEDGSEPLDDHPGWRAVPEGHLAVAGFALVPALVAVGAA